MTEENKVVCAWCDTVIKDGEGPVSHGLCPDCEKEQHEELEKFKNKNKVEENNMERLTESATDTIIAWIIFKKLLRKATDTDAYKLGLIDKNFKILHKPKTKAEKKAMTLLDKLIFRIQNLLGSKITLIAYTGLMISSVEHDNEELLMKEELENECMLEEKADQISDMILKTKTLSEQEREFVINRVVNNLVNDF